MVNKSASPQYELYFLIVISVFLLFGIYYFIKARTATTVKHKGVSHNELKQVAPVEKKITAMYVPKDVGHRTGNKKVFVTNKGLRVYETNEQGLPLPAVKTQ